MTTGFKPEIIFTDVDDTLTLDGELPVVALDALYRLRQAGILVIPVTGACAGWCDQMARLWPVTAVIGENGAFCIEKQDGQLIYVDTQNEQQREKNHQVLRSLAETILEKNPVLGLAQDNIYRRYDLAIDYNQHCKGATQVDVQDALNVIHSQGGKATASSIHINMWLGEHDKTHGALAWLNKHRPDWTMEDIRHRCAYIGDSLNDEAMFAFFENTAAVANIAPYLSQLKHLPGKVLTKRGGEGFSEWVNDILAVS
jgi:HAD superfamily hydrolase (TIGR01484 family)